MRVRRPTAWLVGTLLVVSIVASTALASPGGLDSRGGHHCRKSAGYCAGYGVKLNKYHCHRSPCNAKDIDRHRRHGH